MGNYLFMGRGKVAVCRQDRRRTKTLSIHQHQPYQEHHVLR